MNDSTDSMRVIQNEQMKIERKDGGRIMVDYGGRIFMSVG